MAQDPKQNIPDAEEEQVFWQSCSMNCGSRCALQFHVKGGKLLWVESDNLPEQEGAPQMRACLRGRSMRYWLNSSNRLDYPLRRIGKRGEGKFERIGWDEAIDLMAHEIKRIVAEYGNQAILIPYATGLYPIDGSPFELLLNCYGGYLGVYGDYSCMQLQEAIRYTYGDDGYYTGSVFGEAEHADIVVLFGNSPADTRMGGAGAGWEFEQARERGNFKVYSIDPRHTETVAGYHDKWLAIRPGTDVAFICGVAYVLITEGLVDEEFLDTYCIGYDAKTLPKSAPQNAGYKDYILGNGDDGIAKTPTWAARICGIPTSDIVAFARDIARAKALFVTQGWGPQRHESGEMSARAIPMLAILTGNVGLPGTNSGVRERYIPFVIPEDSIGINPVKTKIPAFLWLDAISRGSELSATNAGIRGADRLSTSVKMIINHAGNCLVNQHADINRTHKVLSDETACEFIVVCDVQMTESARYADLVLPDVARVEQENLVSSGNADIIRALVHGEKWCTDLADRKPALEIAAAVAEKLGVRTQFASAVKSLEATIKENDAATYETEAPTFEELKKQRLWRKPYTGPRIAYQQFRADPAAYPLSTPSGKIEIYSERLAQAARILEYDTDQVIHPLPIYSPESEGFGSKKQREYPFQLIGYHSRQNTHSSFANVHEIASIAPHELQINPHDAQALGLNSGEAVYVENDRGCIEAIIRVTPRIMPGVLALPQGAWHRANMKGDKIDIGGCINTLTSSRPTPLARGNASHSNLVRVRKVV